jgi:branched-chain amino acid transport system substrate-binding protein
MTKTKSTKRITRRRFMQGTAATGAALAAGPLFAPAVKAANTIKLGFVSPKTGPLAPFAESDDFNIKRYLDGIKSTLNIGGSDYTIEVIQKDSQSSPSRAAEVAQELIVSDKVNLVLVGNTPETVNPVTTTCEVEEVPCISNNCPWQPYFIGRQGNPGDPASWKPFEYTYHYFWGLEDIIAVFNNMWDQLDTNKQVGGLFPNDNDGNAWGDPNVGLPKPMAERGYKIIDPGRYQNLSDDFTAQITAFKNANCEIVTGVVLPPDFTTFWNQAAQQGFRPKAATVGKAILFPSSVDALGKAGNNLSSEVWWSPTHPFKSSLTGQSAGDLAKGFSEATGKQWTQPIGFSHSLFEVVTDVLKRTADVNDPKAIVAAIRATDLQTIVGPIKWDGANLPPFAQQNVCKTPLVGGQWRLQDNGKYDILIVDNKSYPSIPTGGQMEPIS